VHRVLSFTRHLPAHGWACTVVAPESATTGCATSRWIARAGRYRGAARGGGERAVGAAALAARRGLGPSLGHASRACARSRLVAPADSYVGCGPSRALRGGRPHRRGGSTPCSRALRPTACTWPPRTSCTAARVPVGRGLPDPGSRSTSDTPDAVACGTPWRDGSARCSRRPTSCWPLRARTRGARGRLRAAAGQGRPGRARGSVCSLPNGCRARGYGEHASGGHPRADTPRRVQRAWPQSRGASMSCHRHLVAHDDVGTRSRARELFAIAPEARNALTLTPRSYDRGLEARSLALGLEDVVRFPVRSRTPRRARSSARGSAAALESRRGVGFPHMVPGISSRIPGQRPAGRGAASLGRRGAELVERAGGTRLEPGDATRSPACSPSAWPLAGPASARTSRGTGAALTRAGGLAGELARALDALVPGPPHERPAVRGGRERFPRLALIAAVLLCAALAWPLRDYVPTTRSSTSRSRATWRRSGPHGSTSASASTASTSPLWVILLADAMALAWTGLASKLLGAAAAAPAACLLWPRSRRRTISSPWLRGSPRSRGRARVDVALGALGMETPLAVALVLGGLVAFTRTPRGASGRRSPRFSGRSPRSRARVPAAGPALGAYSYFSSRGRAAALSGRSSACGPRC